MGSLFSTPTPRSEKDLSMTPLLETLPTQEPKHHPYYGLPVPPEASMKREDSLTWYTEFFQYAECLPHRDGNHIIVWFRWDPRGYAYDKGRELAGWPIIKMQKVYELLETHHPRIVRYAGALDDGSIVLERLWPGPFDLTMPTMTVPIPSQPNIKDKMLLSLYYRWALQGLSALSALHSRGVYMRTFDPSNIWLRSDFSLAVTGFIGAVIPDDDTWYGDGSGVYPGENQFDGDGMYPCVEEDIFYWATFFWKLMTNDFSDAPPSAEAYCWEPYCPPEGGCPSQYDEKIKVSNERWMKNMWQELEDARLGKLFVKAWNKGYTSAEDVAEEIRAFASRMDIIVIGADEVHVDRKWEDIFTIAETGPRPHARRLEFRELEKSGDIDQ